MNNIERIVEDFKAASKLSDRVALAKRVRDAAFDHHAYGFSNPVRDTEWQYWTAKIPQLMIVYKSGVRKGLAHLAAHP